MNIGLIIVGVLMLLFGTLLVRQRNITEHTLQEYIKNDRQSSAYIYAFRILVLSFVIYILMLFSIIILMFFHVPENIKIVLATLGSVSIIIGLTLVPTKLFLDMDRIVDGKSVSDIIKLIRYIKGVSVCVLYLFALINLQ